MSLISLLVFILSAFSADGLHFLKKGESVKTLSRAELEQLVKPEDVSVWEPHESRAVSYRGFPFTKTMEAVFGAGWKKEEEVLFICSDGYRSSLNVSRFEKPSYLVFERKGQAFELTNSLQGGEKVQLGPFYLVWDNKNHADIRAQGAYGWPYQVTSIDLVRFQDRYPQMSPPPRSPEKTMQGFFAFRTHCAQCHSVNGDGGVKGIELNYPVSVTEYFKRKWLKQWILDPSKMRLNTSMPALNHELPNRLNVADNIVTYLETMAKNKKEVQVGKAK